MTNFVLDLLAAGAILSGLLVITSRNPVISVLYLIAVFVNAAGYLLVLGVGFIGISYLIVYVGAIAILFLFVVMLLNINISQIVFVGNQYTQNLPLGLLLATLFFVEIIFTLPIWDIDINLLRLTYLFNTFNDILINNIDSWITHFNTYINFNITLDNNITTLQQVQSIGINLFTISPLWLILASFILLLAMIGPIVLCLRIKPAV